MRTVFTATGVIAWLSFLVVLCLVLCSMYWEWQERRVRAREQRERETVNHLARFTGALRIINLAEYRARKANGPSASHVASEPSLPVVPTGGGDESLIISRGAGNA